MQFFDSAFETIRRESDLACSRAAAGARREITGGLNQFLRRLRQYSSEEEWMSAVLDGAAQFAAKVALFLVKEDSVRLGAYQNLALDPALSFAVNSAPAFSSAINSKEPVVALRTIGEVSLALSSDDVGDRVQIIPLFNGSRVVAVLFSTLEEATDLDALEFVAGVASIVLERQSNASLHLKIAPVRVETAAPAAALPAWAELSDVERNLHIRAQRFSRTVVAEMQLARPEACEAGREQSNLYMFLKNDIDKARDGYRNFFMHAPSMVDYLHLELVRSSAEGDESKLGIDYPGQLSQ